MADPLQGKPHQQRVPGQPLLFLRACAACCRYCSLDGGPEAARPRYPDLAAPPPPAVVTRRRMAVLEA